MNEIDNARPVLYFDGVCDLCNSAVQFVIRHDKKKQFLFASLQSEAGQSVKDSFQHSKKKLPDSIILKYNGKYFVRSAAILRTMKLLGGALSLLYGFMIVPRFIRDGVYDIIARNRYQWFGRQAECMIPTPELRGRFL